MARKRRSKVKKSRTKGSASRRELSWEELYRAGAQAFRAGDYHEAVLNWSNAYQKEPAERLAGRLGEAYFRRGLTFYPEGKLEQVISDLHWAVKLSPQSHLYHYHLGLAYHRRGNWERALSSYGQALELAPERNRYRYHFGLACIDGEKHIGAAEQMFTALVAAEPDNIQWKYPLAVIYLKRGEWEQAQRYLEELQSEGEDAVSIDVLLGLTHLQQEDYPAAQEVLKRAVQRLSSGPEPPAGGERDLGLVLHYLGLAQAMAGNVAEAHRSWQRSYDLGFRSQQLETNLAWAHQWAGAKALRENRLAEAVRCWEQAVALGGSNKDARQDLIHLYFLYAHQLAEDDRLEEAAAYYEKVAAGERNTEILHNLALVYDRLNQPEKSAIYWQRVIKEWDKQFRRGDRSEGLRRNLNEAHKHLGRNCLKIGQEQRACRELQRALDYLPGDPETRKILAEAHLDAGDCEEAIDILEQLVEDHPENVEALVDLGIAYDTKGEEEEALEAWQGALEIQPDHAFARRQIGMKIDRRVQILLKMNRLEEALQELEMKLEVLPDDQETRCLIGGLYLSQRQERRAQEYFEQARQEAPEDEETYLLIGGQYLLFGYDRQAEEWFDRAEDLKPDDPDVLVRIGIYYLRAQQAEAAEDYFQDAVELAGSDKSIPKRIAMRLYNENYLGEAREYFERTVRLDPQDAVALHRLAHCYAYQGELDRAGQTLDRAEELARKQGLWDLLEDIEEDRDFGWEEEYEDDEEAPFPGFHVI